MDGVPLKMPQAVVLQEVKDDVKVTMPDYLSILRETEYEFSLENWVLTGLQTSPNDHQRQQPITSSSELLPSCPPYWMMFSSPQQSHLASRHSSNFWEPSPRQRSHSLSPAVLRTTFTILDSEHEGGNTAKEASKNLTAKVCLKEECPALCQSSQRKAQRAFIPDLLNPPSCLSSLPHKRRKNLRQCSLSGMDMSKNQDSNTDRQSLSPFSYKAPYSRASSIDKATDNHKTADAMPLKPTSWCRAHHRAPPYGGLSSALDSSVELLSALSKEERELLGVITSRGYPLRTAIIALQRAGQQTPDQILSYLVACEHLCQLGYDMAQVEEALEMFQNCETKAEEFLHLLSQFNEMGFQPHTVKEVLLVHENHRERALEELMMRVA